MTDYSLGYDPHSGQFDVATPFTSDESGGPYIPQATECRSCGFCVSQCPTYKARMEESYSPRGRVRLIEKVLVNETPLTSDEEKALKACTQCLGCETVCPSKMAYGELYQETINKLNQSTDSKEGLLISFLRNHLSSKRWLQHLSSRMIELYQQSGLQWLTRKSGLLKGEAKQLDKLLPPKHETHSLPYYNRALIEMRQGKVALFTGCLANIFDTQVHQASIKLLTRLGYEVFVPKTQTCCGAMQSHHGDKEQAIKLAEQNIEAFSESRVNAILYNASGCGAFLNEYPELLDQQDAPPSKLVKNITDIMSFLETIEWPQAPTFRISRMKVAVHEPCTQRNQLKNQESIYNLLKKIPGLEVVALPGNNVCCGAGGTHMITQPELAEPMRDEKVKALIESGAEILLSSNMACAMHLASGIREAGKEIEVIHPVQLLARQLV